MLLSGPEMQPHVLTALRIEVLFSYDTGSISLQAVRDGHQDAN